MTLTLLASIAVALIIGIAIGRYLLMNILQTQKNAADNYVKLQKEKAQLEAELILKDAQTKAETSKKERELQAKEKFFELKKQHDTEIVKRNQEVAIGENRVKQKEQTITQKIEQLDQKQIQLDKRIEDYAIRDEKRINELNTKDTKRQEEIETIKLNLNRQIETLETKKSEIANAHNKIVAELEKVANMSADEAKNVLIEQIRAEAEAKAKVQTKEILEEAKLTANKEAKKLVIQTLQRTATEHSIENAVSVFNIKNDEIKGQIIGREGRNIRALEAATGVEIIVDDTPEAIVLSCFDPLKREIARLALHRLVADGRMHPARIEEVVAKTTKQLEEEIADIGERTCMELGIAGLHPDLVRLVGKMRYRSSYGQNLLEHSKETANLCATMAAELGLNAKMAKRAGLLHDIGKVPDDNPELPHAILGMKLAEKYKEHPIVCNAIGAHHDEVEMTDILSAIVQICDAISGSRPGARREILESYIKRLKDMEALAISYKGVEKAFAIQAGRELRVIVESEKVSDEEADILSIDIAERIEKEMQYPGQVKVAVIREKRAVAYAK